MSSNASVPQQSAPGPGQTGQLPLDTAKKSTPQPASNSRPENFFEAMGGSPAMRQLVRVFYEGVADDPLLRPMYPEEDLGPAEDRLRMFLEQYWGGPRTYSQQRGHPRLRMRHVPFKIGPAERDAWLYHMRHGVDSLELPEELDSILWDYLERAAHFLVNSAE